MKKRRIVYTGPFDPHLGDGVSGSIFDLLKFFISRGHEVFIISLMHDNYLARQFLLMEKHPLETKILSKGENCCNFIMGGINIYFELLPLRRDQVLLCNPLALERYLEKIREYSDSCFLTADTDCTCLVAHSILGTSSVHFIHSPAATIGIIAHDTLIQKIARRQTVFTVSKNSQEMINRSLNIQSHIWPPFIDSKRYRFPRNIKGGRKIGYYSADQHKGDDTVKTLVEEMPDYHFVIMGNGFQTVRKFPNVTFLGPIIDLNLFYGEISLLLVPSIVEEGYPRVILEAAFNGIPAIANRIGGIPEAIGSSGILIDMGSPDKMVEEYKLAITDFFDEKEKNKKYRNKAIKRAEEYKADLIRISTDYDNVFF